MIKFAATLNEDDGTQKQMIGLGISEGNVLKLKAGLPIKVDLRDMGITEGPVRYIGLFYGGTDQELVTYRLKPSCYS